MQFTVVGVQFTPKRNLLWNVASLKRKEFAMFSFIFVPINKQRKPVLLPCLRGWTNNVDLFAHNGAPSNQSLQLSVLLTFAVSEPKKCAALRSFKFEKKKKNWDALQQQN